MCLYPKLVRNPKYLPNKKNGGKPPVCKDKRTLWIPAKCGQCIECRQQTTREWMFRIESECQFNQVQGTCVTLSFSEESLDKLPTDANTATARAIRLFGKRWQMKFGKMPRYWLKPELGHINTERLHIHGFMWVSNPEDIESVWGYGNVKLDLIDSNAIKYATKYINKPDKEHDNYIGKVFCSKGIGWAWTKTATAERYKRAKEKAASYLRLKDGRKINIPTYLRRKLFTDETREKQWLELLDKNERYVMGTKIQVTEDERGYDEYLKAIQHAQAENELLGYPKNPWGQKKYMQTRKRLYESSENVE